MLPYANDRHNSIAFAILVQGYPLAAEILLSSFPETAAGEYVRARALVQMQRLDEASTCFEKVVSALEMQMHQRGRTSGGLLELLPSSIASAEGEERVAAYYRHAALFFEPLEALEHVIRFCQASIDAVGTYADKRIVKTGSPAADAEAGGEVVVPGRRQVSHDGDTRAEIHVEIQASGVGVGAARGPSDKAGAQGDDGGSAERAPEGHSHDGGIGHCFYRAVKCA